MFKRFNRRQARTHSKATCANVTRRLRLERLEPRQLLTGVEFESVMAIGDGVNPTSVFGGIAVDETGNRYVTGYFQGTVDFDPDNSHAGDADTLQSIGNAENAFVAKYDPSGLLQWVQSMGGAATQSGQNARSRSVALDAEGNVYVAGTFQATVDLGGVSLASAGGDDAFVARLDSATGSVEWAQRWGDQSHDSLTDDSLAAGPDGSVCLAVASGGQTNVLKFDGEVGEILWQKDFDWGSRLAIDEAGNVFVAGAFQSPFDADPGPGTHMVSHDPTPMSTFVLKMDGAGDFAWARILETHPAQGSSTFTTLLSMALDNSGSVILGGNYFGNVDFDPSPASFLSLPAELHRYVAKFSSDGQLDWAKPLVGELTPRLGEASSTLNIALLTDSANNIYASGNFRGVVDFDAGTGSTVVTSQATDPNSFDSYFMSLSADGEFRWATTLGNPDASISIIGMDVDSSNQLHVGGSFYGLGPVDFDPGNAVHPLSSAARSGFVLTLNAEPGVTISSTTGLVTTENGDATTFAVSLDAAPTADVVIPLGSSDATEGAVSPTSLTFTAANWNVPQTVTVTGVDDPTYDGNVSYTIVTGTAASADSRYQGINPADVSLTNNDNDPLPTKFYVVNDASQNRTYEYGPTGSAIENYTLNSGNSAPRGAASTVAGDKTWVVDANRKVYIYSNSGALLGSWTPGTLASNATVEGIATNGTDVWIIDARNDRVYRYTGAASRLSGSQNAASTFALNSGNRGPKGITTDGTYLWVVNNNTTDKVFKYTLSGALVGSWTISSGGGSPTGITIDPANVSDIWIVDSNTDRVYQFIAAASRTSGSQSPASSFALAAGNTNPQGIADPPAPLGSGIRQNSGARPHSPKSGDFGYASSAADFERATRRASADTRLSAIDLVFASEDEAVTRRLQRVGRALHALVAH
jgi:hypothetical protein